MKIELSIYRDLYAAFNAHYQSGESKLTRIALHRTIRRAYATIGQNCAHELQKRAMDKTVQKITKKINIIYSDIDWDNIDTSAS